MNPQRPTEKDQQRLYGDLAWTWPIISRKENYIEEARVQGDVELVFVENRYDPDPADTNYENVFVYLIRRGGQLQIETDRHLAGIFELRAWSTLLREVGFEVEQIELDEERIPLFVCTKQTSGSVQ